MAAEIKPNGLLGYKAKLEGLDYMNTPCSCEIFEDTIYLICSSSLSVNIRYVVTYKLSKRIECAEDYDKYSYVIP